MSKPSWDDAPEWAQFVAQDQSGAWYWYEYEPSMLSDQWHEPSDEGRVNQAYVLVDGWVDTLERRP